MADRTELRVSDTNLKAGLPSRRESLGGIGAMLALGTAGLGSSRAVAQTNAVSVPSKRQPGATNDNAAFAAAMAEASATGRAVYFPKGQGLGPNGAYLIGCPAYNADSSKNAGNLLSNVEIYGDGKYQTFIYYLTDRYGGVGNSYLFFAHADASGNKHDITIRDLSLVGDSQLASSNSQALHLIALAGVSRVRITNVEFRASQGDGIFLGDPFNDPTHNDAITIQSCTFDGVNDRNRNGISILDASNWLVESCYFTRWGAATEPGAIDIEPELDTAIIRDGNIVNCSFQSLLGNAFSMALRPRDRNAVLVERIWFQYSTVYDCRRAFYYAIPKGAGDPEIPVSGGSLSVHVRNLYCERLNAPFSISGAIGVHLYANTFRDSDQSFLAEVNGIRDCMIEAQSFVRCGKVSGPTIKQTGGVANLQVVKCRAYDCGVAGVVSPFYFATGGSITQLVITGNHVECTVSPPPTSDIARRTDPYPNLNSVLVDCNTRVNLATYGIDNLVTTNYASCTSCNTGQAPCG